MFVVSILGDHTPYKFPEPIELELRLKDILESEVDEKFYLDKEKVNKLIINSDTSAIGYIPRTNGTQHQSNTIYKTDAESPSLQARDYKDPVKVLQVGQYDTDTRINSNRFRTYNPNGISASLTTMGGGGREPHVMLGCGQDNQQKPSVMIKNATKKGYLEATHGDGVDLSYPESNTRRGRVQKEISQTLTTDDSKGVLTNFRIRKLTPKECWRLMGFSDEDFYKSEAVNSNSQLYKQAGNSIVVPVLEAIFKQLFKEESE